MGRHWPLVAALTLASAFVAVRAFALGEHWVNPDEGIYYALALAPTAEEFWAALGGNAHPPLYYLTLRLLASVTDDFVLWRVLSLACAGASIAGGYLLGRELGGADTLSGKLTGVLAAGLLALSPALGVMSVVLRPYTMQLAACLLAAGLLLRYLRTARLATGAGYSALLTVALLTHYSSLLVLAALVAPLAWMLLRGRSQVPWKTALWLHAAPAAAVAAVLMLHVLPRLAGSAVADEALAGWLAPYLADSAGAVWSLLLGTVAWAFGAGVTGPCTLALVAAVLLLAWTRRPVWIVVLPLVVAVAASLAGEYPFGCSRHSTYLVGFLAAAVAFPLARGLAAGWRTAALVTGLAAVTLVLRAPLGSFLGADGARIEAGTERILARKDLALMGRVLARVEHEPGLVLMSAQCFYQLLPLYLPEYADAENEPDRRFFRFRWGRRTVLVHNEWELSVAAADRDEPFHLAMVIEQIDAVWPELAVGGQQSALLLFGGWSMDTPAMLVREDEKRPEAERVIASRSGVVGLYAFDVDLARYVRATAR